MNQRTFFDVFERQRLVEPRDPNARDQEKPRLRGQNARVLAMLEAGPCTNLQFNDVRILRYSARIHDLRRAGYKIATEPGPNGVTTYRLER